MAKTQTRRTVSMNAKMWEVSKRAAKDARVPHARYVHEALAKRLLSAGIPAPTYNGRKKNGRRRKDIQS